MRLLTPDLRLKSIYDLDKGWLRDKSIKAVITDLDNTLVPWRDYRLANDLVSWFRSLHDDGFKTVILTNARPSPTIRKMSENLNTSLVVGARKPISHFFRQALRLADTPAAQSCVIGDQIFTDILGGNIMGCHTVLVEKIGTKEFFGTKLTRIFERAVLRRLDKK